MNKTNALLYGDGSFLSFLEHWLIWAGISGIILIAIIYIINRVI